MGSTTPSAIFSPPPVIFASLFIDCSHSNSRQRRDQTQRRQPPMSAQTIVSQYLNYAAQYLPLIIAASGRNPAFTYTKVSSFRLLTSKPGGLKYGQFPASHP